MDIWGVGCVFYEIVTLMPLFPGKNEIDQIHKIHEVFGTPNPELLAKFQKHASSAMDFNFPKTRGIGLEKKIDRTVSKECLDLMKRMLIYNPEERITAKQALKHPYFKEMRESERKIRQKRASVAKMLEASNPGSGGGGPKSGDRGNNQNNGGDVDMNPSSTQSSANSVHRNGKLLPNVGKKHYQSSQSSAHQLQVLNPAENGNSNGNSNNNHSIYAQQSVGTVDAQGDVILPSLSHPPAMNNASNKPRKYPYYSGKKLK